MGNMFWLAGINLVIILLIALLFALFDRGTDDKQEKTKKPVNEHKGKEEEAVVHTPTHTKKPTPKSGNSTIPFVVSIVVAIVAYKFTQGADLGIRFVMTLTLASIVFILLCLLWKVQWK